MEVFNKYIERAPKLNIAINITQFLLFTVNLIFAVIGTLLIVLVIPTNWISFHYALFLHFDSLNPIFLLITAGVIMFIFSFFGGIATIARSTSVNNIYILLLFILLIVETNVVITTFFVHSNIYSSIEANLFETLNNKTDLYWFYVLSKWEYMQDQLNCCGINHANDWAPLHIDGPEIEEDGSNYTVPFSCCSNYYKNSNHCDLFPEGCFNVLSRFISYSSALLGYITLAIVISQILGLIFAFAFSKNIRQLETVEEMKNDEIQSLICSDLNKPEEEKPLLTSSSSNS